MAEAQQLKQGDSQNTETISICDVMKENTHEVIRKMESQIPVYIQLYSDFWKEYLHSLDDFFGTCYISEKEFFDKIGVEQNTLKAIDSYWKSWAKITTFQIDASTNFMKSYLQMRIGTIKSYEDFVHKMMDNYAKSFSQINSFYKK